MTFTTTNTVQSTFNFGTMWEIRFEERDCFILVRSTSFGSSSFSLLAPWKARQQHGGWAHRARTRSEVVGPKYIKLSQNKNQPRLRPNIYQECQTILKYIKLNPNKPVVQHKALAEVSKIRTIGEVSCCDAWMAERTH